MDGAQQPTNQQAQAHGVTPERAVKKGCHRDTLSTTASAESPISAIQARTAHLGRKVKGYSDSDSKRCHVPSMAASGGDGMAKWTDEERECVRLGIRIDDKHTFRAQKHMRVQLRKQGIEVHVPKPRYNRAEDARLAYRQRGDTLPGREWNSSLSTRAARLREKGEHVPYVSRLYTLEECQYILETNDTLAVMTETLGRAKSSVSKKRMDLKDRIARGLPLIGKRPAGMPAPKRWDEVGR